MAGRVDSSSPNKAHAVLSQTEPARAAAQHVALSAVPTNQTATVRGTKPYVLICENGFEKPLRLAAESLGVRTVEVISEKALLVEADAAARMRLAADRRFSSVSEFLPSAKIAEDLLALIRGGAESVEIALVTLSPADHQAVQERVVSCGGEILKGCFNEGDTFRARLPASVVSDLAACGDVRWMEVFVRPQVMNDVAVEPKAMNIRPLWLSEENPLGLSGAGQIISTSDSGIDTGDLKTMHADLTNQICGISVVEGCADHDGIGHGTHTAGSIVGDGTMSGGKIRGTAWGAKLFAWFCGKDGDRGIYTPKTVEELFQPDQENYPAYIHSGSWGSSQAGAYTTECVDMDKFVWEHPDFLPVFSAGNDGSNGGTIGSPAAAKNVLTVGATQNLRTKGGNTLKNGNPKETAEYSSRGPCKDGRIKPDIAAPGTGVLSTRAQGLDYSYGNYNKYYAYDTGTSMACPLTAGAVALVREWLVERQGYEDTDDMRPTAALMKAVITGGAKDAEKPGNEQGWGRVDLQETLAPSDRAIKLFDRLPFAAGEEFVWEVETTNDAPLDVQLAWVDYPGTAAGDAGAKKLVNDLDLTVEPLDSDGEIHYGNGGAAPDSVNNLESVRLASVKAGKYLIRVDCKRILYDSSNGGAAALYVRGAFDPEETFTEPEITRNRETGKFYSSLDRALEAAEDGQTVEILRPARLRKNVVLGKSVTITATNENAFASAIARVRGATLTVTNGVAFFTNVVFAAEETAPVRAAADGAVQVAGVAVFDDLCSGVPGIVTETDRGFILGGELLNGLTLSCAAATADGTVFGSYVCDYATATQSAVRVASLEREDRLGRAVDPGEGLGNLLVWQDGSTLGPDVAVAAATVGSADPVYYRSLASLLEAHPTEEMTVTLMRAKATLDRAISIIGRSLSLESSFPPATTVTIDGKGSVFTVGENGALSVKGVVFGGDVDRTFILVKDGGECTLGEGAAVRGLSCKFSDPAGKAYGPIAVTKGTFKMLAGSEVSGCRAEGATQASYGGGIYLGGIGCELDLFGGAIFDCHAKKFGGGVYAHNKSVIRVSGAAKVCGNSSDNYAADDIYLAHSSCKLIVAGAVAGGNLGVRYAASCASGNEKGDAFATIENDAAVNDETSFFNDLHETLRADTAGTSLVWGDKSTGPRPLPEEELERAVVATVIGSTTNYYAAAEEAFEALDAAGDVLVLTDAEFGSDLVVKFPVTLRASEALHPFEGDTPWSLVRTQDCSLVVGERVSLTMTNVTVRCDMDGPSSAALVDVCGAKAALFLKDGATVCDVYGGYNRASCGIKVWDGATITMESGSSIQDCLNMFANPGDDAGCGGGLLLDHATAYLHGGEISGCRAFTGGGICLANESTAYVSGDMTIDWNADLDGFISNLVIQDLSNLVLDGKLTGEINCCEGYQHSDPNVIGTVAESVSDAIAAESAHNFIHDTDGDIGMMVVPAGDNGKRLLVWSNAITADGTFVGGTGATYELTDAAPFAIPVPMPEFGLVYDGEEKEGVLEDFGYTLEGAVATDAGGYTAVATLKTGFVWDDEEETGTRSIDWEIAQAEYDEDGIIFAGATVTYDGKAHFLAVKDGTLPEGVMVSYEENGQVKAGKYEVKAKFTGDEKNYANWKFEKTAELVILKAKYDMSAIVFHDVTYSETGTPLSIEITGALPEGVTVEYVYEGPDPAHAAPGVYKVTAKFTGDAENYEPIGDMTATMTIVETQYKEGDDPKPVPVPVPEPFSVTSITRGTGGSWTLVVNPVAKYCRYTFYASDDLTNWSPVGEPVVSDVDQNLIFTPSAAEGKKFWKVVAEPGVMPAE